MAHIYMTFDFAGDEEKAQQARHKLDVWKQAFRLDKKLLYKFERSGEGAEAGLKPGTTTREKSAPEDAQKAGKAEKVGKSGKAGKAAVEKEKSGGSAAEKEDGAKNGDVKLHLRLAFSGHEKMTEERWVKRIPSEEPFKDALPKTVRQGQAGFEETEASFESLE